MPPAEVPEVPVCMGCWAEREDDPQETVRMVHHRPRTEICFVCGQATTDGMYVRLKEEK